MDPDLPTSAGTLLDGAVSGRTALDPDLLRPAGAGLLHGAVSGEDVPLAQATLKALGYDPGSVDGIYGKRTAAAVGAYQSARRLPVDGVIGPETWRDLASEPDSPMAGREFRRNLVGAVSGERVRDLQGALLDAGFKPGDVDGVYGPMTAAAVTRFQSAKGVPVDGIVGPRTEGELSSAVLRLSPTITRALDDAQPADTACGLGARVLADHGEYAGGKAGDVILVSGPDQPRRAPSEWLSRVRSVLDPLRLRDLHGRLFVIALALLDPDLRSQLEKAGVFDDLLAELREPLDTLLSPLGRDLLERRPDVDQPTAGPDLPPPVDGPIQFLAGATVDTVPAPGAGAVRNADRLGITADVEMLVSVLVAKDTPLPLAVGLFGDWGTGKSFFMSEMEERTAELAHLAAECKPEGALFCREVRQIRFNAWHYADADLWASLASTLFDHLARPTSTLGATGEVTEIDTARKQLADAQAKRTELAGQVTALEATVSRTSTVINVTVRKVLIAVRSDSDLRATLKREADSPGGSAPVGDPTEQLVTVLGGIDDTAERARTVWALFTEEAMHRHRLATVVTLVAVIAALGAIWSLADWATWAKGLSAVAGVLVALSPALVMAGKVLTLARQAREAREKPLNDKLAELTATEQEIVRREGDLAAMRDQGLRLQQFVRARAASSVYRDKLGVISQVRTDFEELVGLIEAKLVEAATDSTRATSAKAVVAAASAADVKVPNVERIVLYIDDLDRCPPEKVVDVLQAVHLLLAFKLFVVVVGVDSRWLKRSLNTHFADMLEEPEDYLEKIFQIPFALRRMTATGYRSLIAEITPAAPVVDGTGHRSGIGTGPPAPVTTWPTAESAALPAAATVEETPSPAVEQTPPPDHTTTTTPPDPPLQPRLEALYLTDPERLLLQQLGSVITTPRSAKRLVNIYRMLRVSVPDDELDRYRPDGGGEYQCVVLLLAVLIGLPGQASNIFARILSTHDQPDIWTTLGHFGDITQPLRTALKADIKVTDFEPYARWAPRVARFSFRMSATTTSVKQV